MTDRTFTPVSLPAIVAVGFALSVSASSAWAQTKPETQQTVTQTAAPTAAAPTKTRHLDVEAGVGAHVGIKNDAPIDDDVAALIGFAAPIASFVDGELLGTYLSGSDNDDDDNPNNLRQDNHRGSRWLITPGVRWYPFRHPESAARFFVSTGFTFMLNYYERDDYALGMLIGPGVRLRAGQQSGLVVRAPVAFGIEHDSDAMIIPTISYFWQF